jgi:hypothetical protein
MIAPPVTFARASIPSPVETALKMCAPLPSGGASASAPPMAARSVLSGSAMRAMESKYTTPSGWRASRCPANDRAAPTAAWIALPRMNSLASISSTAPKWLWPKALAGTTESPLTGAPFSATETWPGLSEALAGSVST